MINSIFGTSKPPQQSPADLAKEWKRKLTKEGRELERSISEMRRQEDKALKECKKLAKTNHLSAAKILAKQVGQTRKEIQRMVRLRLYFNKFFYFPLYYSMSQNLN